MSNIDKFLTVGLFISALLTVSTLFYDCRPLRVFFLIMLLVFQMACYYRAKNNWGKNEKDYYRISYMPNAVFAMADSPIDYIFARESRSNRWYSKINFCYRRIWCIYWLKNNKKYYRCEFKSRICFCKYK